MRSTAEATRKTGSMPDHLSLMAQAQGDARSAAALAIVMAALDDAKAEDVVAIDLAGKSAMADHMIIATGRSDRHVGAIADQIAQKLKDEGFGNARLEGRQVCDWVLIDSGDIIVHVFKPAVRAFYNLEKMWMGDRKLDTGTAQ